MQEALTVGRIFSENRNKLKLKAVNGAVGCNNIVTTAKLNRPGVELTGFWRYFDKDRIQMFGLKEKKYLSTLSEEQIKEIFAKLFSYRIPAALFAHRTEPPPYIVDLANRHNVALMKSPILTMELGGLLMDYLAWNLAPTTIVHGSLVDVYGVGLLITGRSGIGKSEIALDLVERGHRLVADDVVRLTRRADNVIIGKPVELLKHHIEVRGLGIIDLKSIFGIRAIREQKRLEVQVELMDWSKTETYERIGAEENYAKILDVDIPLVKLPIYPGKNITVICEVIALNHMVKVVVGKNSAREFEKRLMARIKEKARQERLQIYLKKDFE
jgi:HPr kinase/phosphorylase